MHILCVHTPVQPASLYMLYEVGDQISLILLGFHGDAATKF